METTTTLTETAPAATNNGPVDAGAVDVAVLLARLAQVTDQLATTIHTNCNNNDGEP